MRNTRYLGVAIASGASWPGVTDAHVGRVRAELVRRVDAVLARLSANAYVTVAEAVADWRDAMAVVEYALEAWLPATSPAARATLIRDATHQCERFTAALLGRAASGNHVPDPTRAPRLAGAMLNSILAASDRARPDADRKSKTLSSQRSPGKHRAE